MVLVFFTERYDFIIGVVDDDVQCCEITVFVGQCYMSYCYITDTLNATCVHSNRKSKYSVDSHSK